MDLEKLAFKAQEGDKKSLEDLIIYFKPYIINQARLTYIKDHTLDDLIQIGYVSLMKAIKMYKPLNKNFNYYALASIKRNFYYLIRQKARYNYEYSMDYETGEGLTLGDSIENDFNLEEEYLKKETNSELMKSLKLLNIEDQEMIKWVYFDKKTLMEYSKLKGVTYHKLRYRLTQVLKKLREHLLEPDS